MKNYSREYLAEYHDKKFLKKFGIIVVILGVASFFAIPWAVYFIA